MIPSKQLEEWQLICDEATSGPWDATQYDKVGGILRPDKTIISIHDNAVFIANSRTALPACIEEIRRLREALKSLIEDIEIMEKSSPDPDEWEAKLRIVTESKRIAKQALGEDRDG